MKNNHILISLRNLLVTLIIIAIALTGAEFYLAEKNKTGEKYWTQVDENDSLLMMQFERIPTDKIFMSATNVFHSYNIFRKSDIVPELKSGYPLIDDLTKETEIDDALNIVVIGDSFVWGYLSTNRNELFWRLLENEFRNEGIKANVYGVGAVGANAYEELSWLTDSSLVQDIEPDMVIFGYVYNDSEDAAEIITNEVDWNTELPLLSKIGRTFPNLYERLITKISSKTMYSDKYSDSDYINIDGAPPVLKGRFYEKYKNDFVEKLNEYAATVDFPIVVMTLPTVPKSEMLEALYQPLEDLYSSCENISFYDSFDDFNKFASPKHSENYKVNIADFHPGSATNKFYTDYIKEFIEKDFPHLFSEKYNNFTDNDNIVINEYLPYRISLIKTFEDNNTTKYTLEYPSTNTDEYNYYNYTFYRYFLVEPLGEEHIKLSFSDSIDISSVKIQGQYDDVKLYYTCINQKLGYDDHSIYEFDTDGNGTFYAPSGKKITSVLLSAQFSENEDRQLTVSFEKSGGKE